MTVDDKADVQLARDVLTETLHGPVPMATVARLAQAVLRLDAERDIPCAHRLEEERLEAEVERLRAALSANLESAKDGYMLGGAAARAALVTVVETARAALEGKPPSEAD